MFRAVRMLPVLLALSKATAQDVDVPPPPPPFWTRPLTWINYEDPAGAFRLEAVSDSLNTSESLWHMGRTRFVSGVGVWPQTSIETTGLYDALRSLSTDSLAGLYWV